MARSTRVQLLQGISVRWGATPDSISKLTKSHVNQRQATSATAAHSTWCSGCWTRALSWLQTSLSIYQ